MHIETLHYGKSSTVRNAALCAVCVSAKRTCQQLCGGFYHKEQEWVYQKEKTWHVWNTSLQKRKDKKKDSGLNTAERTLTCTKAHWGIADSTVWLKRNRWRKTDDACFKLINKIFLALRVHHTVDIPKGPAFYFPHVWRNILYKMQHYWTVAWLK